jgi:TolB-like protein/class 3 adenylate cyclase
MGEGEISFGRFRLNLTRRELRRDKALVRLGRRALDILCVLASAGGAVVTKDELMAQVWAGVVVEENNLQVHISALRKVLEEDGDVESSIATVPGRGYRLLLPRERPASGDPAPGRSLPAPDKPSIAVMPFLNLSGDPEQEYFADGMVEEIITALSHIRWLFVIARNSTFTYKGQAADAKRIGRELGVRYVLEGSVRKGGNRVRIMAQLIDADSGGHLWADHFEGQLADVFDLQDNVAASVAGVIEPELQTAEAARSAGRQTADLTAYDLFLRAHAMYWASARQIPEALRLLEQAIDRAPRYALSLAWAALCCHRLLIDGRSKDRDADRLKGIDYAHRALQAARDDPGVLAIAAVVLAYFGEDLGTMTALVDRALALNPSFALGWFFSGQIRRWAGELDTAIAHAEAALRLNPRGHIHWPLYLIGSAFASSRRFEEAIPKLLLAIENDKSAAAPYRWLVACYAHTGRLAEARATLARLRAVSSVLIPDASNLRNIEHRELFLSGLRLATGEENIVIAAPARVDSPLDAVAILRGEAEHRQITALSCELVGIARGADGVGLEDVRETVGDFQRRVSETADRHGGFTAGYLGDNVLVLFGYPTAHEHDAEQAVRAGFELCATVRALRSTADVPMQCRVGVATGTVIVGAVGGGEPRDHEIVGDPPDQAKCLAASTQSDTVAIDSATRRLIGNLFDYRALGTIETTGGTGQVHGWLVLGESGVESRFEALHGSALSPLIGRDEEVDLLLRRWARAKAGEGQIALVSGEAGIGKSRIAAELEERLGADPHFRLRYFCSPYHQDSALFPFVDQLGHAAGFARDDMPAAKLEKLEALLALAAPPDEDVALLADLLSLPASERHPLPSVSPQRKKDRTMEALIRQLEGLAGRQPVVVVFEDVHWIDPTSRELLDLTVDRVRSLPVLLIVTFRPDLQPPWTGQPQVTMLALNRLDRRDRISLATQIAEGRALPDEVVAQIVDRTDGVPLFVEELTKSVLESGLLRKERDRYLLDRALPHSRSPRHCMLLC